MAAAATGNFEAGSVGTDDLKECLPLGVHSTERCSLRITYGRGTGLR